MLSGLLNLILMSAWTLLGTVSTRCHACCVYFYLVWDMLSSQKL